jgi:hypothetical protein
MPVSTASAMPLYLPNVTRNGSPAPAPAPIWHPLGQLGGAATSAVIVGQTAALGVGSRVVLLDVSDPDAPYVMGEGPMLPGIVMEVAAAADRVYALTEGGTLQALDVREPMHPRDIGRRAIPGGWYGHLVLDAGYLYVATSDGIAFVDTDALALGSARVNVLPTWAYITIAAAGGRLYVIANAHLMTYDPVTGDRWDADLPAEANGVHTAVATERRLYLSTHDHLVVVDMTDPSGPIAVGRVDGDHAEVALAGPWLFTLQFSEPFGLTVMSLTDPDHPVPVAVQPSDEQWHVVAAGEGRAIVLPSDSKDTALLADTSALPALRVGAHLDSLTMPVWGVIALGDVAYVSLRDGWRIFDLGQPDLPLGRGVVRPWVSPWGDAGADLLQGDRLYLGRQDEAGERWIDILDVHAPLSPTLLSTMPVPGLDVTAMAADDRYVYMGTAVTDRRARLDVLDAADAASPRLLGGLELPAFTFAMAPDDGYVYVGADQAIVVVDTSNALAPLQVARLSLGGAIVDLQREGRLLLTVVDVSRDGGATHTVETVVVDVTRPTAPAVLSRIEAGESSNTDLSATTLLVDGGRALVGARWGGVDVVDVSNPTSPRRVTRLPAPGDVLDMAVVGDRLYTASADGGLVVLSLTALNGLSAPTALGWRDVGVAPEDLLLRLTDLPSG